MISFDTICNISYLTLTLIVLGVPAWMVFAPPRTVRVWPLLCRPLLACVLAQASAYALWYGFIYPASSAYSRQHPGDLLCGILCGRPSSTVIPILKVTAVFFLMRSLYLVFQSKKVHL